jgi:hypothetical protein
VNHFTIAGCCVAAHASHINNREQFMSNMIFYTHSGWRYIVIVVLVVAVAMMLIGWLGKRRWGAWDQRIGMITPIVIDIQWLLGLILWIMRGLPTAGYFMEHIVTMTLALIAAHIGWSRTKRATDDTVKFRTAAITYIVAGILVGLGVARVTGWM